MPIGYRMGKLAMEYLGVERGKDHGFFVFPEIGEGHPQTCMVDCIQVATGATYRKKTFHGKFATFYGKHAATFYHPKKGAVRYSLKPKFIDAIGKSEFFVYRKKGIEPSKIPQYVTDEGYMSNRMDLCSWLNLNLISNILLLRAHSIK